ncbi:DDE-type integrase/transposase/recombinase, partial [Staphylococcus pettenkoferi]|uniref:DDE-type integrase/transposase/recombinase n=1 Tax=Staphylococcus pettenkoferi TaxID=170573 RepID=UPI002275CD8B
VFSFQTEDDIRDQARSRGRGEEYKRQTYANINRLIIQFGKHQKVITDQAPSTNVAMAKVIKAFKLKPEFHCTSKYLNNLIEQDHRHIKVRKTRYQSINTAKNTLKGIECIYALYKKNRRSLQIYGFSPCHEISIMLAS